MPLITRVALRSALLMLVVGGALGLLIMYEKAGLIAIGALAWSGAHIELMLFGWLFQLAMGVAIWMLPKFYGERRREVAANASVGLLNLGVLISVVGLFAHVPTAVVVGRLIEASGGVAFVAHAWQRIKPFGDV